MDSWRRSWRWPLRALSFPGIDSWNWRRVAIQRLAPAAMSWIQHQCARRMAAPLAPSSSRRPPVRNQWARALVEDSGRMGAGLSFCCRIRGLAGIHGTHCYRTNSYAHLLRCLQPSQCRPVVSTSSPRKFRSKWLPRPAAPTVTSPGFLETELAQAVACPFSS